MSDNGDKRKLFAKANSAGKRIFSLILAVFGWGSLFFLLWGLIWGCFPNSSWAVNVVAGIVFFLTGLLGMSEAWK